MIKEAYYRGIFAAIDQSATKLAEAGPYTKGAYMDAIKNKLGLVEPEPELEPEPEPERGLTGLDIGAGVAGAAGLGTLLGVDPGIVQASKEIAKRQVSPGTLMGHGNRATGLNRARDVSKFLQKNKRLLKGLGGVGVGAAGLYGLGRATGILGGGKE